jgi:hypothetical protein
MRAQGMVQMMAAVGGMSLAEALIVPAVLVINLKARGRGPGGACRAFSGAWPCGAGDRPVVLRHDRRAFRLSGADLV